MKILGPTPLRRLNELVGLVSLVAALYLILILVSFYPQDASWNTAAPDLDARNLGGQVGAYLADILLQSLGLAAFLLPALLISLSWHWVHSKPIEDAWIRVFGGLLLFLALSTTLGFWSDWRMFDSTIPMGGLVGSLLASTLLRWFNLTGSVLVTSACMLASLYLLTTFSLRILPRWMTRPSWIFDGFRMRWSAWLVANQYRRDAERAAKEEARAAKLALENQPEQPALARRRLEVVTEPESGEFEIPIRTLDSTEEPPPLAAAVAAGVDIPSAELPWEQPVRAAVKAPPPFFPAEPAVVEYRPPQPAAALSPLWGPPRPVSLSSR